MDIKSIINEELKTLFENLEVYTIPELVQMLKRKGEPEQNLPILEKMLRDAYKRGGDDAVVEMYSKMSGVEIEALRNGRYVFHNLTGGGEPMLEVGNYEYQNNLKIKEVMDNANHTPDEMPS